MGSLPERVFTAAQVRELDRRAIEDRGIPGYDLMTRAGAAAFRLIGLRWPAARRLLVYCGGGNNGGDGLVVARLARAAGLDVRVALAGDPARLQGAAREAWEDWTATGGDTCEPEEAVPADADLIVDALLGTGLDRPVRGRIGDAISAINASGTAVLALDIPSGLQADTGTVMGAGVHAHATITFIGAKRGLYTAAGPDHTGPVHLDALGVAETVRAFDEAAVGVIGRAEVTAALPRHKPAAHKGDRGRILVVGGDHGYAGAPRLCAEAALRVGAGLVTVATRGEHAAAMAAARPELMARAVEDPAGELPALIETADVVVAGPGLGRGEWGRGVLATLRRAEPARLLLDADALNLLAEEPENGPSASVLTPHPGEAGRLLGTDAAAVQADRFGALEALVAQYACTVVLKGAGTLVGSPERPPRLLAGARPELAVGGSGDVLGGLVAGLLAQRLSDETASIAAAWLHAAVVEAARGSLPSRPRLPSELARSVASLVDALIHPPAGAR